MGCGGSTATIIVIVAVIIFLVSCCLFTGGITYTNTLAWRVMDSLPHKYIPNLMASDMSGWLDNHPKAVYDDEYLEGCPETWELLFDYWFCPPVRLPPDIETYKQMPAGPDADEWYDFQLDIAHYPAWNTVQFKYDWDELLEKYGDVDVEGDCLTFDGERAVTAFDIDGDGKLTDADKGYTSYTSLSGPCSPKYRGHNAVYDVHICFEVGCKAYEEGIPGRCRGHDSKDNGLPVCSWSNINHSQGYGIFSQVSGTVIDTGYYDGWGYATVIYNAGYVYIYAHQDPYKTKKGLALAEGESEDGPGKYTEELMKQYGYSSAKEMYSDFRAEGIIALPLAGEEVKPGQVLGYSGGGYHNEDLDGVSSGSHLDFTVIKFTKGEPNGLGDLDPHLYWSPHHNTFELAPGVFCDFYNTDNCIGG